MKIVIEHEREARVCVVHLSGEIDMVTSEDIRDAVSSALTRGCRNVVLDLADVDYADSSALSLIVALDRAVEPRGGKVVLAGANAHVGRVLELSGLVGVAPTISAAESAADAIQALALPALDEKPGWHEKMELAADPSALASIRARVCDLLAPLNIVEATMFDIRVAVGEAIANAMRHGSPSGAQDVVTIDVSAYSDRVVIVVEDVGAGFDGIAGDARDLYAASGRGVLFMRALMDSVEFVRMPDGGTSVTLVKHIGQAPGV